MDADAAAAWFYFGLIAAGTLFLCGVAWALERRGYR